MQSHTDAARPAAAIQSAPSVRPWREAVLAGLGVTAIALLPLLIYPRFYFNDDYQSYFMPMFREIARLVLAGEFPLSTPKIWFGGALAGEYQYAVFHPVCLTLYTILSGIGNLVVAATVYSLIHVFVLAAGIYALCRYLGCAPLPAFIGALIAVTSSWLLYWGASNWIPALVSQAWMVWALYFLLRVYESRRYFWIAVVAVAFTLLAGWPFANLALLLTVAVLTITAVGGQAHRDGVWRVGLALAIGALLAMPALLSAAGYMAESAREPDVPHSWGLTLNGLFSAGVPSAVELWTFSPFNYTPSMAVQMLYASWLVPLAIAVGNWRSLWQAQRWTLIAVLALAGIFALGSMMPGVWQFRWFFRLLPYYHAALAVLAALLLTHAAPVGKRWKWHYPLALALVLIPFIIPVSLDTRTWSLSLLCAVVILLILVAALEVGRRRPTAFRMTLIGGHVLVLLIVVTIWPRSLQVPTWDYPASGPQVGREDSVPPRRLALYDSSLYVEPGAAYWSMIAFGNTAAYLNAETVNGYSPPVQRDIARFFCFDFKGGVCAEDAVSRLFTSRRQGLNLLDLVGVEEVATDTPEKAEQFAALAGDAWQVAERKGPLTVFGRTVSAPGGLTAPSPKGLTVTDVGSSSRRVVFDVRTTSDFKGGELVVRRPRYPGTYARLNGKRIELSAGDGAMPIVALEPGAKGRLVVGYWPRGLGWGLLLAALGLAGLGMALCWPGQSLVAPRAFGLLWNRVTAFFARPSEGSSPT